MCIQGSKIMVTGTEFEDRKSTLWNNEYESRVTMRSLNQKMAKLSINKRSIFELVRTRENITRKEITAIIGLKTSTTVKLVSELIEEGMIVESKIESPKLGRRPAALRLSGDLGRVIGVDLGRTGVRGALMDAGGSVVSESEESFGKQAGGEQVMKRLLSCIESLAGKASGREIIGIGIGVSGMIDYASGTCLFATGLPDFENVPVRETVEKKFSVPVIVDDSSRTHAVGERFHGLGRDVSNFIHVVLGEGIGAGIFINGSLYRGKSGISGEIGHIVIDRNGPRCRCGNHGCLEKYASGSAIAAQIEEALAEGVQSIVQKGAAGTGAVTAESVTQAANQGDKLARGVLTRAGERIGQVLASVVSILAPEKIIISGGVSLAGDLILEPIRRIVKGESAELLTRGLAIEISQLQNRAGTLGAARMALINYFEGENAWLSSSH